MYRKGDHKGECDDEDMDWWWWGLGVDKKWIGVTFWGGKKYIRNPEGEGASL